MTHRFLPVLAATLMLSATVALLAAPAFADDARPKGSALLSLGFTNATVNDGLGNSVSGANGFTMEAVYQYPLSKQFAVEGGFLSYDISGGNITADGSGLTLSALYDMPKWGTIGFGMVPDGVRLYTRKMFQTDESGRGLFWQLGLTFSDADRVDSFAAGSIGYKF